MIFNLTRQKCMRFLPNSTLLVLFLFFSLFSCSSFHSHLKLLKNLSALEKQSKNPVVKEIRRQSHQTQETVWNISNKKTYGTAFAIGPNLFATALHVLEPMLKNKTSFQNISLQKDNSSSLKIKRIIALSPLYDLALLETTGHRGNHLKIKDSTLQSNDALTVMGYPGGTLKEMKKTGKSIDESFLYTFSVNHSHLPGVSGSPVLNHKNQVKGIALFTTKNVLSAVKSKYLKELAEGQRGINCSDFTNQLLCLKQGKNILKTLAKQGNTFAQFQLGSQYRKKGTKKNTKTAFQWIKKSAEQGYAPAQGLLAMMYSSGEGTEKNPTLAFHWMKKSVKQGYAPDQHELGKMYHSGEGTEKNIHLAFHWMKKSAEQGYDPAQIFLLKSSTERRN